MSSHLAIFQHTHSLQAFQACPVWMPPSFPVTMHSPFTFVPYVVHYPLLLESFKLQVCGYFFFFFLLETNEYTYTPPWHWKKNFCGFEIARYPFFLHEGEQIIDLWKASGSFLPFFSRQFLGSLKLLSSSNLNGARHIKTVPRQKDGAVHGLRTAQVHQPPWSALKGSCEILPR